MFSAAPRPSESAPPLDGRRGRGRAPWPIPASTLAAVGIALAWLALQIGRFLGEAPDLDAMISLRESIVFHREGLDGLLRDRLGAGVHPPLADLLTSMAFAVFGEDPRSQQLLAIVLFAVLAAAAERLLAPWLPTRQRAAAAFAIAICPAVAITIALVAREGIIVPILVVALAIALRPPAMDERRLVVLGCVLALFPLLKDTSLVLIPPFVLFATLDGDTWDSRLRRGVLVAIVPLAALLSWRAILLTEDGGAWQSWIFSDHQQDGPYVVAIRAMLGLEDLVFLRQNLANAFLVNWLWVPAGLAVATVVLTLRRPEDRARRRAVGLLALLIVFTTWTTLAFPTYAVPRYAAPVIACTVLLAALGVPLWPQRMQTPVLAVLIAVFALGAWSPTDPVSRKIWGTVSVGGERFYNTTEMQRGPDRTVYNFAALRASERVNARLRRVFASDVTMVVGDCNSMKFGEKLFSVGFQPSAFDREIPGARPIRCVLLDDLPPEAVNGPEPLGLLRTPEDLAENRPLPIAGPAVVVLR
ncbi:MAG: glycosyltransferase family 39 protein [Dehalococcoidia bacterium]|nr:glycosyltransferase family 39 protein [Dehalococcoidia bacterium]